MEYPAKMYENAYACKFRQGSILLGAMLNTSTYSNLGFDWDDKNYLPTFSLEDENGMFTEECYGVSRPFNGKRCKYILFFLGCDDASCGLRFKSREDRDQFLKDHPVFTEFIRSKCLNWN